MKAAVALVGLLLLGTSVVAPALADEQGSSPLLERVARELAARGGSLEDLPATAPLYELDLATGAVTVREMPLAEALEAAGGGRAFKGPSVDGGEFHQAHRVAGDVFHLCFDLIRHCYLFYTNTLGPGTPTRIQDLTSNYNTVKVAYDGTPLSGAVAFPLKGAQAVYVQGRYTFGFHIAADALNYLSPGSPIAGVSVGDGLPGMIGGPHGDRAMWGTGVGRVTYTFTVWTGGVISFGTIRGYGAWTFCGTEFNPACVPAP